MSRTRSVHLVVFGLLGMAAAWPCRADEVGPPAPTSDSPAPAANSGFFSGWFARKDQAQATQPHWMTPLVTVTPRLEEEVRYDQLNEQLNNGQHVVNYGGGKGLELIPTTTNEVILNVPPYLDRTYSRTDKFPGSAGTGFGDWPALLVKQRLLSAPESEGNYILTAFLAAGVPIAAERFTPHYDAWAVTPTIAGGKGWGDFDIQSTLGVQIPVGYAGYNGKIVLSNTTFQYHFARYFWPEIEVNESYWTGGPRGGKYQTFLTPGIILGRFSLGSGINASFGVGYQIAVTPDEVVPLVTPLYNRALLTTGRITF